MYTDELVSKIIQRLGSLFEEYKSSQCELQKIKIIQEIKELGEKLEKL
ncbi:hypothetical protein P4V41_20315 [Fictibacillus nanhaiensis]|nr:hypothetical protein [Fictibacillus nanhaiensis]